MSEGHLGNKIILSRNDLGHYVLTDYMGTTVYEGKESLLRHIRSRLDQQDHRLADYKRDPNAWNVTGFSEMTC